MGRAQGRSLNAADLPADLLGRFRRLVGERFDLGCDHGKALAHLAGARRFDGRIQGEEIGLAGDVVDELDHRPDLLGSGSQLFDLADDFFRLLHRGGGDARRIRSPVRPISSIEEESSCERRGHGFDRGRGLSDLVHHELGLIARGNGGLRERGGGLCHARRRFGGRRHHAADRLAEEADQLSDLFLAARALAASSAAVRDSASNARFQPMCSRNISNRLWRCRRSRRCDRGPVCRWCRCRLRALSSRRSAGRSGGKCRARSKSRSRCRARLRVPPKRPCHHMVLPMSDCMPLSALAKSLSRAAWALASCVLISRPAYSFWHRCRCA